MHRDYLFAAYILANFSRMLYVGVTGNLVGRVWRHREGLVPGFTRRYSITRLVYYELTTDVRAAIAREKELKRWSHARKVRLIERANPGWLDLAESWFEPGGGGPRTGQ
ncbi:MAG TPA: GIY-YIG nuclease family protein [Gemmatimonadaceae bacterium]|nr:GIY-YIG nuclease family protein [Gemmatimonadaceae bacterium]